MIRARLVGGGKFLLVPVAAVLVAGIRVFPSDARPDKGDEMGWFEPGSTILVFAPPGFTLHESLREGMTIRAGQPLMRCPEG